jgi:two-component system chemotaxis response regulator CheB
MQTTGPRPASSVADVIAIGASTGGVVALQQVLAGLPADLPASVFVVLHQRESGPSHLVEILRRATRMRVGEAVHGGPVERGRVYVAPLDNHVLVRRGTIAVVHGPRENGHRPAVDPLFRTAAASYGARVAAVVLTGALGCGAAGLLAVKARGGVGIVQDPATAACAEMPRSAIRTGAADHVLPLDGIAPLLIRLATEARVVAPGVAGRTFGLRGPYVERSELLESSLWAGVRALEESTALADRMAKAVTGELRRRFDDKARATEGHARMLRAMILGGEEGARLGALAAAR